MEQYINKSALISEIERRTDELYDLLPYTSKVENSSITATEACNIGKYTALELFRKYIDTLEVKEVDLENIIREEYLKHRYYGGKYNMLVILNEPQFNNIAKHFFELGLKSQKRRII